MSKDVTRVRRVAAPKQRKVVSRKVSLEARAKARDAAIKRRRKPLRTTTRKVKQGASRTR